MVTGTALQLGVVFQHQPHVASWRLSEQLVWFAFHWRLDPFVLCGFQSKAASQSYLNLLLLPFVDQLPLLSLFLLFLQVSSSFFYHSGGTVLRIFFLVACPGP